MTLARQPIVMMVMTWIVMSCFITCVLSAIPGPKDPRYPDEIVMPKVKCESEGVFPHPRNCTWYYRCVDRMNVGYFWTYHFECEPGTVFSDELDQCIFPFLTGPPCGTAGSVSPSPITPATLPVTPVTPATLPVTPVTPATLPVTPVTPATLPVTPVTPATLPVTPVTPATPEPVPITPAAETTVLETEFPTTESPITETTTTVLIEENPITTDAPTELPSTIPPATVQPENPEPTTESATPVIIYEDTTTLEPTTISSTNIGGIFSCTFRPEDCVTHSPCPPDTITRTLCTGCYILATFVEASNLCNQEQGKLYDKDNRVCVTDPALNPDCFPTTTVSPEPTTTPPLITVAVTTEFDITCSAEATRPQADWILNRYCQYYYLCTSDGSYTGAVRLCDNYYQCYLDSNNRWATELMSCSDGQLFTYDQDKCVNAPTGKEVCAFIVRQG